MFDLRRFGLLARAHWAENNRAYGWFLAAGVLLHVAISILMFASLRGFEEFQTRGQSELYFTGLFLLAPVFAGRYFLAMSSRGPALLALMRPASVFEKWLLAFGVVAIAYPIAYTVAFEAINVPDWLLASARAQQYADLWVAKLDPIRQASEVAANQFDPTDYALFLPWEFDTWRLALDVVLKLWSILAIAVFGSLFFRTVPFIKTLLAALLFCLAVGLASTLFDGKPELVLSYWNSRRALSTLQVWGYGALWLGFPTLLWLACLLRLKEREIAA